SSRRRHTRFSRDWSSDVCSSDLDRRADELCAVEAKALDGGQEGRAFHDDLVAGADERLAQQVQGLLAAGGDDEIVGRNVLHALRSEERRAGRDERWRE